MLPELRMFPIALFVPHLPHMWRICQAAKCPPAENPTAATWRIRDVYEITSCQLQLSAIANLAEATGPSLCRRTRATAALLHISQHAQICPVCWA